MKHCNKCHRDVPIEDWYRNAANKDGLSCYCKPCWKEYSKAQYQRHREKKRAYAAAYGEGYKERRAEVGAIWRAANRERITAQNAVYRAANKKRKADYQREWQRKNPEKVREATLRRWALRKNCTAYVISPRDLHRLMTSPCAFPGCNETDIELDHVIPLSRGGTHGVGNLQPLCRHHNRTKHDKTWIEYRAYLALRATA